jgi:D-alanyl-D-alanine dipeptidase
MKEIIYQLLEDKMLTYVDLTTIAVQDNGEPLIPIRETANLTTNQIDPDMLTLNGEDIYVRESVANKIGQASLSLATYNSNLRLDVVYGYRSLDIQTALFQRFSEELANTYNGLDLTEATHRLIAEPSVAGHPTGGAVDIQITDNGTPLNFGADIWQFDESSYTFNPFINKEAWQNRLLLRRLMISEGFAPFDGEWWHFSYGDREWAYTYGLEAAIYDQIPFIARNNE